jgi:hypothetical protein
MHKLKEEDSLEKFLEDCEADVDFGAEFCDFWGIGQWGCMIRFWRGYYKSIYIYIYIY